MYHIKLPSGVIVNADDIEYVGCINAIREPKKRKPKYWTLTIQFMHIEQPITLSYENEAEARADYNDIVETFQTEHVR